jgi:hypothetical protein
MAACCVPCRRCWRWACSTERYLTLPKGYYGLDSLLILLAFMALARLKSIESLR